MVSFRNLRVRISVAFFAISMVLSGLYAIATFLSFELVRPWYSEERFIDDLDGFIAQHRDDPRPGTWETPAYRAYVAPLDDLASLPERLRGIETGQHQIEHAGEPTEIRVEERGGMRYLIEYDIDQILAIESEISRFLIALLAGGVLLSSLLALGFGYWMSSRIIRPLTRLARQVEALDGRGPLELAAGSYGTDEVAELGQAFERYFRRLGQFAQREKDFAAAASHELRTSAASISSGVELMMTEDHGEPTRSRLERLQRAGRQMGRLIEALLVLAREGSVHTGSAHTGSVHTGRPESLLAIGLALHEIVEGRRSAAVEGGAEALVLDLSRAGDFEVSPEGLEIVVGNLIDNAVAYAPGSDIRVTLVDEVLEITDDGPGIPAHELPHVLQRAFRGRGSTGRGAGLGLSIVHRLCEHHGWTLEIDSPAGLGTTVRIGFGDTPPVPRAP